MPAHTARNPYLDFLRALAICAVLVFHIAQSWPVQRPWLLAYTQWGAAGVDLFFVLSGWLIGTIYCREYHAQGRVRLMRFWGRRWMRTIPPYMAALAISWLAVWIVRNEPFDLGYLFFLQNYYLVVPFFLISWSLCVEEHFYLFVPLMFQLWQRFSGANLLALFALCIILPTLFRLHAFANFSPKFGYYATATHLYADGLLLGFFAAYLDTVGRLHIAKIRAYLMVAVGTAFALLYFDLDTYLEYALDPLLLAVLFSSSLLLIVHEPLRVLFQSSIISWLAKISYSVYLTHALLIHIFLRYLYSWFAFNELIALIVELLVIIIAAWLFYWLFERSALHLRERIVPTMR